MRNKKDETNFTDIEFFCIFLVSFLKKIVFSMKKTSSLEVEEELDYIDIDEIGTSLELCSSMRNVEILKQSDDGGQLTMNIDQKKK